VRLTVGFAVLALTACLPSEKRARSPPKAVMALPNDDVVAALGADYAASTMAPILTILRRQRCREQATDFEHASG
jgi:hypothetical protein